MNFPFFPQQASTVAGAVDNLFFFVLALALFFVVVVGGLLVYFGIKYRRRTEDQVPDQIAGSTRLEVAWTVIPIGLVLFVFIWSANLYLDISRPPDDAMQIYVVARQWMWRAEHLDGQQEINELHVPMGRSVRLTMISQDVIHSFYVPSFRVKADVLPGRYTTTWFQATEPGRYHLFCAEYCGTAHSGMVGWVEVMRQSDFDEWQGRGASSSPAQQPGSLTAAGGLLFEKLGCGVCHGGPPGRAPSLVGLYGKQVTLQNGQSVTADESYIRESILEPNAKVVAGYQPIMPSFQGRLDEQQLLELVAFIQSLGSAP